MPDDVVSFFGDDDWHWARDADCVAEVLSQIEELSHYYRETFPEEPWIPGATVNGYTIAPITASDDLRDEGKRMHHCVGNYVQQVVAGSMYFYHVSKDGERVATVQLEQTNNRYIIEQIKGVCNADVPGDALKAVKRWIVTMGRQ